MNSSSTRPQNAEPVLYKLVVENRLDELTTVSEWINELASQLGISPKGAFRLDLALAEAVSNIIDYAFDDEETHSIEVTLQYANHKATIQISDDGKPFDPLQAPEIVLPRSLEEAQEGGLGIHLMRHYTDECHYRRQDDKNVLSLVIHDAVPD